MRMGGIGEQKRIFLWRMVSEGRNVAIEIHRHFLFIKITPWVWPQWVAASFGSRWFQGNLLGKVFQRVLGRKEVTRPAGQRKRIIGTVVVIERVSPQSSVFIPGLQIVIICVDSRGSRLKQVSAIVDPITGKSAFFIQLSGV